MLKNYVITTLRFLKRQKLYSFINIFGLSIGLALFILAVVFFCFHLSFDSFHQDSERIYLITSESSPSNNIHQKDASTYLPLANLLVQNFPEVENATVYRKYHMNVLRYKNKKFYEYNIMHTDQNFLDLFTFPAIKGDFKTPLKEPNSMVLTKSAAEKYFGQEDPIGKIVHTDLTNTDLMVTAIIEDCPHNSSIRFDILISLPEKYHDDWGTAGSTHTFVKLKSDGNTNNLEAKFPRFIEEFIPLLKESKIKLSLFPLKDIHFKSMDIYSSFGSTPIFQYYLIIAIALSLLIIVSINFMVLSTSRYGNRAKEVGIRKVIGAHRGQLIKQYIGESILLCVMALPLAIILFEMIKPVFIAIMGGGVELPLWQNPFVILIVIGVTLIVGFISGIYPAFFLSSFQAAIIIKGNVLKNKSGLRFRKGLVIFQFMLSFIMIAFTLTSIRQLNMMSKANLGYDRTNIIALKVSPTFYEKFDVIEKELQRNPNISMVAGAHVLPFNWNRQEKMRPEGVDKNSSEKINCYPCGYNFIESLHIKIIKGRSFSREFNDLNSIIISEETAKHFNWDDPVGKVIVMDERGDSKKTVIGVAKDFHFPHVFNKKAPAVIYFLPKELFYLYIKTISKPESQIIDFIQNIWNEITPDFPFEYFQLEFQFQEELRSTTKTIEIFKFISIVSVFISCLGLFALASYTAERKIKEIGIRKVLGASVKSTTKLLISEFMVLVFVSDILALPFAYYCSSYIINVGWIYQMNLSPYLFVVTAVISIITALLAVGLQSIKAATANPIEALRYE